MIASVSRTSAIPESSFPPQIVACAIGRENKKLARPSASSFEKRDAPEIAATPALKTAARIAAMTPRASAFESAGTEGNSGMRIGINDAASAVKMTLRRSTNSRRKTMAKLFMVWVLIARARTE
jgi:hypothetical protein